MPPSQKVLEEEYKEELDNSFGIDFNNLYTLINMPVGRFGTFLERKGNFQEYMELLRSSFNPALLKGTMCRRLVSVGWDGTLYDCDFNQALGIKVADNTLSYIDKFNYEQLAQRVINTGEHCFACTAGAGST